jgi:hypothetical protein
MNKSIDHGKRIATAPSRSPGAPIVLLLANLANFWRPGDLFS